MFNPTTCVRLRYGCLGDMLSGFSWESDYARCCRSPGGLAYCQVRLGAWVCLRTSASTPFNGLFRQPAALSLLRPPTYPDPISVDQETLVFRRAGFSPALSLLIPTFAFPDAPEGLAPRLRRRLECSPTNHCWFRSFGRMLMPDYYPRQIPRLVSCYALFK